MELRTITALNAFFLKHEMVVAHRGIPGIAFKPGKMAENPESIEAVTQLGERILDLRARHAP